MQESVGSQYRTRVHPNSSNSHFESRDLSRARFESFSKGWCAVRTLQDSIPRRQNENCCPNRLSLQVGNSPTGFLYFKSAR